MENFTVISSIDLRKIHENTLGTNRPSSKSLSWTSLSMPRRIFPYNFKTSDESKFRIARPKHNLETFIVHFSEYFFKHPKNLHRSLELRTPPTMASHNADLHKRFPSFSERKKKGPWRYLDFLFTKLRKKALNWVEKKRALPSPREDKSLSLRIVCRINRSCDSTLSDFAAPRIPRSYLFLLPTSRNASRLVCTRESLN